jgi:hypothetical protein
LLTQWVARGKLGSGNGFKGDDMLDFLRVFAAGLLVAAPSAAATVTFTESPTLAGYTALGLTISNAQLLESSLAIRDNLFLDFSRAGADNFGIVSANNPFFATAASPIRIDFTGGASSVSFRTIVQNRSNRTTSGSTAILIDFFAQAYGADGSLVSQATLQTSSFDPLRPLSWDGTLGGGTIAHVLFFAGVNDPYYNIGVGELSFDPITAPPPPPVPVVPLPASGILLLGALGAVMRLRRRALAHRTRAR